MSWHSHVPLAMLRAARRALDARLVRHLSIDPLSRTRVRSRDDLTRIGSSYGGWIVPASLISPRSVCYSAGIGEDITFDRGLIEKYGCQVFAFDPTPRAIEHVERTAREVPGFRFEPLGLWSKDEVLRFYVPADSRHVSHSVLNLQRTSAFFEAQCKSLKSLMAAHGHDHLDLLKMDIEGAEYEVIRSILKGRLDIRVLCVEFNEIHHRIDRGYARRIRSAVRDLIGAGYEIVAIEESNYTFVRTGADIGNWAFQ